MNQSFQSAERAESGANPRAGFAHIPVLRREVLAALRPESGRAYFDGTLGGGGHATAVLEASSPNGFLYGCDRDEAAIRAAGRWAAA